MTDNYMILGISKDATPDQFQDAFDRKKAELMASIEDDQNRTDSIANFKKHLMKLGRRIVLLCLTMRLLERKIDPLIGMVDAINAPLHDELDYIATTQCLFCGGINPKEAKICLACGRHIARSCPKCGKILRIDEGVCSRCKTILREYDQTRLIDSEHLKEVKEAERGESQIRVDALEEHHRQRAVFGFVFWLVVIAVFIGLCFLTVFLVTKFGLNR